MFINDIYHTLELLQVLNQEEERKYENIPSIKLEESIYCIKNG